MLDPGFQHPHEVIAAIVVNKIDALRALVSIVPNPLIKNASLILENRQHLKLMVSVPQIPTPGHQALSRGPRHILEASEEL